LNLRESHQVGEVLGVRHPEETHAAITAHAVRLRELLNIDTVVIHPTQFAAAANACSTFVQGPFTPKPKITTGAGDHVDAGFCIGQVLGLDLAQKSGDRRGHFGVLRAEREESEALGFYEVFKNSVAQLVGVHPQDIVLEKKRIHNSLGLIPEGFSAKFLPPCISALSNYSGSKASLPRQSLSFTWALLAS
jgi:hypothetical protein